MSVCKLGKVEHARTRILWEEVFQEDTQEFLDYYYEYMANHNIIYGIKREDEYVSMLHLNPYVVQIYGKCFPMHYIVGVATREDHRKQGLMGRLLRRTLKDLHEANEPITYLMPAAEAIYTPYDFVVIGQQTHYEYMGDMQDSMFCNKEANLTFSFAGEGDCDILAELANKEFEKKYTLFTKRNAAYFHQLIQEQGCQNGGIVLVKKEGELVGYFLTANEGHQQVRELVSRELFELEVKEKSNIPMMVRITNVETLLNCVELRNALLDTECEGGKMILQVTDSIVEGNTGTYEVWKDNRSCGCRKSSKVVAEENVITIQELTRRIFRNEKVLLNEIV